MEMFINYIINVLMTITMPLSVAVIGGCVALFFTKLLLSEQDNYKNIKKNIRFSIYILVTVILMFGVFTSSNTFKNTTQDRVFTDKQIEMENKKERPEFKVKDLTEKIEPDLDGKSFEELSSYKD